MEHGKAIAEIANSKWGKLVSEMDILIQEMRDVRRRVDSITDALVGGSPVPEQNQAKEAEPQGVFGQMQRMITSSIKITEDINIALTRLE